MYITAIIETKVRRYTITSWIYSDKVLSFSISFIPCFANSIPASKPHSPSEHIYAFGVESSIKLSNQPAWVIERKQRETIKTRASRLFFIIERKLKFTFESLYINYIKLKSLFYTFIAYLCLLYSQKESFIDTFFYELWHLLYISFFDFSVQLASCEELFCILSLSTLGTGYGKQYWARIQ